MSGPLQPQPRARIFAGTKAPWRERIVRTPNPTPDDAVTLDQVAASLKASFNDPSRRSSRAASR